MWVQKSNMEYHILTTLYSLHHTNKLLAFMSKMERMIEINN